MPDEIKGAHVIIDEFLAYFDGGLAEDAAERLELPPSATNARSRANRGGG
jgi:hypothetical protein